MNHPLHEIVNARRGEIVHRFVRALQADQLAPVDALPSELIEGVNPFLSELVRALAEDDGASASNPSVLARDHGERRWQAGFDLEAVVREYGVLRRCIDDTLGEEESSVTPRENAILRESFNAAIAGAVKEFTSQERKKLDEALASTREAARAREEIMGVVSHDLKNPLNIVLGNAELMDRILEAPGPDVASLKKRLATVKRAATTMQRLVLEVLDVARAHEGKLPLTLRPESVRAIVEGAYDAALPLADTKSIELCRESPEDGTLTCDPARISQVLQNLLGNGIKYTPAAGKVWLSATRVGSEWVFVVKDSGPGVEKQKIPLLFKRYWRGQQGVETGTGLGLAIAKGFVEAHGGRIWVESEEGKGTSFFFALPDASTP